MSLVGASIAFTPDSTRLLCGRRAQKGKAWDGKGVPPALIEVYDAKTGKLLSEIPLRQGQPAGHWGGPGQTLPFATSNDVLVVAGKNEVATIYDLKTGKALGDPAYLVRVGSSLACVSRTCRRLSKNCPGCRPP